MVNITFNGNVSLQDSANKTVTITVTKVDNSKDTFTATTNADGNFTVTRAYDIAGNYSAVASVEADTKYKAKTSNVVTFKVELADRTITLSVA